MPETQCIKYPVKPGHREKLVRWLRRLKDRSGELTSVMAEGGVVAEAVFLETSENGEYLLILTSARDLKAAMAAFAASKLPVVQEFNQILTETVDVGKAVTLEFIYQTPFLAQEPGNTGASRQ